MAYLTDLATKIKTWANNKFQVKLVSGTNIKTINSISLLGSENINLNTIYYTKTEIDTKIGDIETLLSEI